MPALYYSAKKKRLPWDKWRIPLFDKEQRAQIKELCKKYDVRYELICRLIVPINQNKFKTRSNKTAKEFDRILSQEWVHYAGIAEEKKAIENENK